MPLAAVLDLEEDELEAYAEAVGQRRQEDAWGHTEELLAESIRLQHAILLTLQRGLPVVMRKKLRAVRQEPMEVPRPPWVKGGGGAAPTQEVVVTSLRDFARYLN